MSPQKHILSDFLAGLSAFGSIMAWQDQIDWGFRILASLVAITAGSIAIYRTLRKKKQPRHPLE